MSATPNNVGADWGAPPNLASCFVSPGAIGGQDALQALLAFAYIREQARRRRLQDPLASSSEPEDCGLDEVLRLVAARAVSMTGADGVAIALAEEDAIVCRAGSGRIVPDLGVRLDPNSGFSGACLRRGQTIRCDDSEADSRVNPQACRVLGARSMVAVPLSAKGRVVGLVEAFSSAPYGFNDSDVRSLNLLAELILAAIRPEEEDRLAELAPQVVGEPEPVEASPPAASPTPAWADEESATVPSPRSAPTEPQLEASAPLPDSEPGPPPMVNSEKRSISSILVSLALVVIVVGLGIALGLRIREVRRMEQSISANSRPPALEPKPDSKEPNAPPPTAVKPGALPQVTGLRHWSSEESSTVVVDLEDQVQYEAHTIGNPPRIYFDLRDTKIAPALLNQSIAVNDPFLKRVRMAQPTEGVTRVVLDTEGEAEVSVKLEPSPYRLTIEVRKPGQPTHPVAPEKPSPAISVAPKQLSDPSSHPSDLRIVLDAGHGGWDLGTVGRKGLLEKDLCLDIVERLGRLIEGQLGAQVIYTRRNDTYLPLEKRAEIANLSKASLFLSVHANYSDLVSARGVETYYSHSYSSLKARTVEDEPTLKNVNWTGVDIREKVTSSHRFAADVQQALFTEVATRNPEVRNRGVKEAQYVVLTGTQMPAVLAEVSFVSSPADEDELASSQYRQQIAEALYRGVTKFQSETRRPKLASARN